MCLSQGEGLSPPPDGFCFSEQLKASRLLMKIWLRRSVSKGIKGEQKHRQGVLDSRVAESLDFGFGAPLPASPLEAQPATSCLRRNGRDHAKPQYSFNPFTWRSWDFVSKVISTLITVTSNYNYSYLIYNPLPKPHDPPL